jgi:hypothetical protein
MSSIQNVAGGVYLNVNNVNMEETEAFIDSAFNATMLSLRDMQV